MLLRLNPNQNPIPVDIPTGGGGTGAPQFTVVSTGLNAPVDYGQLMEADPTAINIVITLPVAAAAVGNPNGNTVVVKNAGGTNVAHTVTLLPQGGDTVDNGQLVLTAEQYVMLVSDGVSKFIVVSENMELPTTGLVANAAIDAHALIKASTTAGRYEMLAGSDSPLLMVGVAATIAFGAGSPFAAQLVPGTVTTMLSDGSATISAGQSVIPSPSVAGRIRAGNTNSVGVALGNAAAVLDATVSVL
jgi:hypothetical protein